MPEAFEGGVTPLIDVQNQAAGPFAGEKDEAHGPRIEEGQIGIEKTEGAGEDIEDPNDADGAGKDVAGGEVGEAKHAHPNAKERIEIPAEHEHQGENSADKQRGHDIKERSEATDVALDERIAPKPVDEGAEVEKHGRSKNSSPCQGVGVLTGFDPFAVE